jgi:hypothetical protein
MTVVFEYFWVGAFVLLVLCPLVLLSGCALREAARRFNAIFGRASVTRTRGGLAARVTDGAAVDEELNAHELRDVVPEHR